MSKIVEDILKEDGITMENFANQERVVTTSATGSYRKIVSRATDIKYDIVEHQNNNEDLLNPNYVHGEPDPTPSIIEGDDQEDKPRGYKALRLKFSLRASSYATMFLREVTRMSSAWSE